MANLGRKKIFLDFSTSPDLLNKIDEIKKKVRVTMIMKTMSHGKMEIDIRGSKEDIEKALDRIKSILRS